MWQVGRYIIMPFMRVSIRAGRGRIWQGCGRGQALRGIRMSGGGCGNP